MGVEGLWGAEGRAALAIAADGGDPLRTAVRLREAGFAPDLAAAAQTQVALRARAAEKFGADADRLYFTRTGLEQATRALVADRRARRLAAAGATRVADLGCGIGADTIAFARAGLRVLAVEADQPTVEVARANVAALGLTGSVEVRAGDATTVDLSDSDAAFCDPARRESGRRVFDPNAYSPPWTFVLALAERMPRTVLKVAPGIDHARMPGGAEGEWVSVDGGVVEAALWCGPLRTVARRATVLRGGEEHTLTGTGAAAAPVAPPGPYIIDPDGAVVRAGLVAELASTVDGWLADPRIAYVFTASEPRTRLGHCFEVVETLPYGLKKLRAALQSRGIGRLEIRKRGVAVEPDRLRRDLKLTGGAGATLVLLRIGDAPTALLCRPASG